MEAESLSLRESVSKVSLLIGMLDLFGVDSEQPGTSLWSLPQVFLCWCKMFRTLRILLSKLFVFTRVCL